MGDGEEPPLLSRSEALSLSSGTGNRNRAGKRNKAAGPRWRHACHVLLYAPLPTGSPQPPFAILMQLRFDGLFGFPGGFVDLRKESLEAGLSRELREELGPAAAGIELRPCHHRGAKAWTGSGRKKSGSDVVRLSSEDQVGAEAQPGSGRKEQSGSDVGVVTHFYIRRVSLEELGEIERGEKEAPEHGLEMSSDKSSPDIEVRTKQRCVIEFLHAERVAPIDIHRRLLKVYGEQTVDVSTVRRWVGRFSSGDSDVKDKPRSGRPCTAVTPRNERRLEQLIRQNPWITTRELRAELKIGFNALETMVATSDYRNVCGMWVPRVFGSPLRVCRDVWTRCEGEGEGFIGRIITVDAPSNSEGQEDREGETPKWSRKGEEE